MNSTEKDIYLELIRAALWERPVDMAVFRGKWRWSVLLEAFKKHDLLGVVANVVILLPEEVKPSVVEMGQVYNYLGSLIQSHRQLNKRLAEVMPKLEAVGCKPLLLKGQGLSSLYPKTCVRACGDLDIYVGDEKMAEAKAVVNEMASPEEVEAAKEHDIERHYQIIINDIVYEIHPSVGEAGNKCYEKEYESLANQYLESFGCEQVSLPISADDNIDVKVLPLAFNVWYVFNHLVDHLCDAGVGLRQFCDWMMIIRNYGISESRNIGSLPDCCSGCRNSEVPKFRISEIPEFHLEETLKAVGLLRAWKILGGILVYQLGLPKEEFPLFDERMAKKSQGFLVDDILNGGRFRFGTIEEIQAQAPKGWKHIWSNLHFYYYISRPRFVLSPWAPYVRWWKFMVGVVGKVVSG